MLLAVLRRYSVRVSMSDEARMRERLMVDKELTIHVLLCGVIFLDLVFAASLSPTFRPSGPPFNNGVDR